MNTIKLLGVMGLSSMLSFVSMGQCENYPDINFGNDTLLNCGETLQLSAPSTYDNYLWSNGSTQSSIVVSQAGTYSCQGMVMLQNVVTNGDFSQGNTGFTSDYVQGTGGTWGQLSSPGTYAISSNPSLTHTNFVSCNDHTVQTSAGSMFIVNGSSSSNAEVWGQTVPVTPNTDYQFSVWATSVVSDNPGILRFVINGQQVGNQLTLSSSTCSWQQFFVTWNSGAQTSAQLSIINQNILDAGNDFALDDISFAPICTFTDNITVSYPPNPTISVSGGGTICEGETTTLTASTPAQNPVFNWMPGNIDQAQLDVSPTSTTVYSVNVTDENNCVSSTVQTVVTVRPAPQLTLTPDTSICFGSTIDLIVSSDIAVNGYDWNSGAHTGTQWTISPADTTLYTVTATSTSNGCVGSAEVLVSVIPELSVEIFGDSVFCEGSSVDLTATSNALGTQFYWEPMNISGGTITVSDTDAGWVYVTGQAGHCPAAQDSIFTEVIPQPDVFVPEDMVVCPGETISPVVTSSHPAAEIIWAIGVEGGNPQIKIQDNTMLLVYADLFGCVSEVDSFYVSVSGVCGLDVPNVFTPNKDGANDAFRLITYEGIEELEVTIFNRWGNTVFQADHPDFLWDGTDAGGRELINGTYFYKIVARSSSGEEFDKHGFVQLVR